MKHFTFPEFDEFKRKHLKRCFESVHFMKPEASRSESAEAFWMYVAQLLLSDRNFAGESSHDCPFDSTAAKAGRATCPRSRKRQSPRKTGSTEEKYRT